MLQAIQAVSCAAPATCKVAAQLLGPYLQLQSDSQAGTKCKQQQNPFEAPMHLRSSKLPARQLPRSRPPPLPPGGPAR